MNDMNKNETRKKKLKTKTINFYTMTTITTTN